MFNRIDSEYRDEWPICFRIINPAKDYLVIEKAVLWCRDQFGEPSQTRCFTWGGLSIWFRDDRLATLFRVRWC
ncbi:MAG: hypothetical protein EOO77_20090 [Oxalobacteraceae bacterium]|nr:MAG: hypothetical protein EOO77_20090 [Oxalobacteraceae bacterium]